MLKLCLAFLFCLLSALPAKADRHGMFVRIECNRDLGLLDIGYNIISGGKIGDFFNQGMNDYVYNIKHENSNTDITLINGYYFKAPYKYHCELAPNQKFDITIEWENPQRYINNGSFYVTVIEDNLDSEINEWTSKKIIDKLIIGAGGRADTIHIAAFDDNTGTNITLEKTKFIAYFMEPEKNKQLSEESLTQELKEMEEHRKREEEYIKENGDWCEIHSCGTTFIADDEDEEDEENTPPPLTKNRLKK
ncbi:MAG: hypothetical protein NC218_12110 [Acetobacter sp.]|nr:hypothetical protein [Acetobacter sp.]